MLKKSFISYALLVVFALLMVAGCVAQPVDGQPLSDARGAQHEFTLRTGMVDGRMVYVGVGGEIDGQLNPDLTLAVGDTARIILENGDDMMHDLAIPDPYNQTATVQTATTTSKGSTVEAIFTHTAPGEYTYYCTIAGHRQAGMEGTLIVTPAQP